MLWLVWLLLNLSVVSELIVQFVIVSALSEFQLSSAAPPDLCRQLNLCALPMVSLEGAVCLLAVLDFWRGWPLALLYGAVALFFINVMRRRRRIFEPLTIVRDMNATNLRHVLLTVLGCLALFYTLIRGVFVWFG
jgi:hypothetical protein